MRLTVRTHLALCALVYCAVHFPRQVRKADIAAFFRGSEAHLGVVVHRLARLGLVETARGRGGGLRLARPAARIRVGEVVRGFEGPADAAEASDAADPDAPANPAGPGPEIGAPVPSRDPACRIEAVLGRAVDAYYAELDAVTLADLAAASGIVRPLSAPA